MLRTRPHDGTWAGHAQWRCRFCAFDTLEGGRVVDEHELTRHAEELLALNDPLVEAVTAPATAAGKTPAKAAAKSAPGEPGATVTPSAAPAAATT